MSDDSLVVSEHCIPASATHLYTLELKDAWDNSWSAGSYIQIDGKYGNTFFKNMMVHNHLETYTLSLLYPIVKGQTWKIFSGSVPAEWNEISYYDKNWMDYSSAHSFSRTGTQYLRYCAVGVKNLAAYEASFLYQHGIIVFVNGNEVFRDNMPSGFVSNSTSSTGSYAAAGFHGFVRPGVEIAEPLNAVAIELHFDSETSVIQFDCFLAAYGASAFGAPCYVMTKDVHISSSSTSALHLPNLFDLDRSSYASIPFKIGEVVNIQYTFTTLRPYVNGLLFRMEAETAVPKEFTWDGKAENGTWANVMKKKNVEFDPTSSTFFYGFFKSALFQSYRLHITDSDSKTLKLHEIQPLVCAVGVPTSILYTTDSFSALAKHDSVLIQPIVDEFTNCELWPSLPEGVVLNSTTCVVSGIPLEPMEKTTFEIVSHMNGQTYSGEFSLTVVGCDEVLVDLERSYGNFVNREGFEVVNLDTGEVVYSLPLISGHLSYSVVHIYLCLPQARFQIRMLSSISFWYLESLLNIYVVLDDDSEELVASGHYEEMLGNTVVPFTTEYPIFSKQSWYYKMGSVPSEWTGANVETFSLGEFGQYPDSPNSIQLYKKTFSCANARQRAGFVLNIRYKAGVIVYLNGVEVWRNNVEGELSSSSVATNYFDSVGYHQVSLPIRTIATNDQPSIDYLKDGENTIAIALVAHDSSQSSSVFDCALHILSTESESRIMTDFQISTSNIAGYPHCFFSGHRECPIFGDQCTNYLKIRFNNDRREWVSSMDLLMSPESMRYLIRSMVLKARNSDSETWETLTSPAQITWSIVGQTRRIFFVNNKPYNQFSFVNFASDSCKWGIWQIKLHSHPTAVDVPDLSYPEQSLEIYQNVEMLELYPTENYYFNFVVNSTLPNGLVLDPYNGMISGIPTNLSSSRPYQIIATKHTGEMTSVELSISVALCHGGKNLITLTVMLDDRISECSYRLYKGANANGELVSSIKSFTEENQLNFVDFCLPHSLYTLEIIDTDLVNLPIHNGFYLTVDLGSLKFETGQIPWGATSAFTRFSSYLPFQINLDSWRVEKFADLTGQDWTSLAFDDSNWQEMKASDIGTSQLVTIYIRRSFEIPNLEDYHVLNVRVRYAGGLVAYFNGRKVARFNLEEDASSTQTATKIHDPTAFSLFHIIFPTVGAVVGRNVIAFEVHRPIPYTSASIITFDATGVFGVNQCSLVLDSYSVMDSSTLASSQLSDLFDFSPACASSLMTEAGSYIHWMVENRDGSRFNAYAWQSVTNYTGWGFSLYARTSSASSASSASNDPANYTEIFRGTDLKLKGLARNVFDTPLSLAPFDEFRFVIDVSSEKALNVYSHQFLYCTVFGDAVCEGTDDFPPARSGHVSPAVCPYGYSGYRYRMCQGNEFSAVCDELCVLKSPKNLKYETSKFRFFVDAVSSTGLPQFSNIIDKFSIHSSEPLPSGLSLNEATGEIRGVPLAESESKVFVVWGENPKGVTFTEITIQVEQGYCEAELVFARTRAGESAVYMCATQGNFVGMERRKCEVTAMGGKWGRIEGFCVSIFSLVMLIVMSIALVILLIVLFARVRRINRMKYVRRTRRISTHPRSHEMYEMVPI